MNVEYRTVSHLFGVGISTVCGIVHQVCNAIVSTFATQYVRMPQGMDLETVVNGFQQRWQFLQCAGAIDSTISPSLLQNRMQKYWNRKQFHSIVMQAVVDYQCRFMDIYIGWPGSVHDARILLSSDILLKVKQGLSFLIRRGTFVARMFHCCFLVIRHIPFYLMMVMPYSDCGTLRQTKFNHQLSRARFVTRKMPMVDLRVGGGAY